MVNTLNRQYTKALFAILAIAVALGLAGCGKVGDGASGADYTVALELPPPPNNYLDHLRMVLRIEGRGDAREIPWQPGTTQKVSFDEDETLTFLGYAMGENGPLLMTGSVRVGSEKKVTIPLRMVE